LNTFLSESLIFQILQVYRLKGEDPEGSRLAYSISGDHLSVVRNTGVVTLVKALDRETSDVLEVIITITGRKKEDCQQYVNLN